MTIQPEGMTNFCDDVRQEIDGKLTLVGVNAVEEILFKKSKNKKYIIPIIGFHMKILIPINYKFKNFVVRITQEDQDGIKKIFEATQKCPELPDSSEAENNDDPIYMKATLAHRAAALSCNPDGKIKVRMIFDNNEPIPMGALVYRFFEE